LEYEDVKRLVDSGVTRSMAWRSSWVALSTKHVVGRGIGLARLG
jgi:hypothetical protein